MDDIYENPSETPHFAVAGNHKDVRYSPEIIEGILSGKQISYTRVKTLVDSKLIPEADRVKRTRWRIDYFCVSAGLKHQLKDAIIYKDVLGSDHCPIGLEINV